MRQWMRLRIVNIVQVAALLAIVTTSVFVHRSDTELSIETAVQSVLDQGSQASTALVKELAVRETIATSIASSAMLLPDLTEEQFTQLAGRISQDKTDIVNLAYAPDLVVRYVHPAEPNSSVIGLDYREASEFTVGARRALDQNRTVLIGPMEIMQGGQALVMRVPVSEPAATGQRQLGLVSLVMDVDRLLDEAGIGAAVVDLSIAVHGENWDGTDETLVFGSATSCGPQSVSRKVPVLDTFWTFCMSRKTGWPTQGENSQLIILLTILATISTAMVFIVINRLRMREAKARTQLWDAIEALNDGFALYDHEDRLVLFNAKYREIYGAREEIRTGQTFREILECGVRNGAYVEAIGREEEWLEERMDAHRAVSGTHEQQLHDGRWIKVSERRTSDGGTVGFRVDITDLKRAQQEAEASNIATTEFLNNINHEIRTPLSVIVGFIRFLSKPEALGSYTSLKKCFEAETLDREATRAAANSFITEIKAYADRVQRSSTQLSDLVQDTLDLSTATRDDFSFNPRMVDLAPLVEGCVTQFSQKAGRKGLELLMDVPHAEIWADPTRLRQVLLSLIGNAVKFTEAGHVKVSVEEATGWLVIKVEDTGPGIAEEHRDRVFQKFWQVDGSVTRTHGGTGLDLAISDVLVKLHGGEIWVEPSEQGGAVFCVRLPQLPMDDSMVELDECRRTG